jgi:hypothetical protein
MLVSVDFAQRLHPTKWSGPCSSLSSGWPWQPVGQQEPGKGGKRATKGNVKGGWSQQEGAWRLNPSTDEFVIEAHYILPVRLGPRVFKEMADWAKDEAGVTVKIRARRSTGGRARMRREGRLTHQIPVIGHDCRRVYQIFFNKALDMCSRVVTSGHHQ